MVRGRLTWLSLPATCSFQRNLRACSIKMPVSSSVWCLQAAEELSIKTVPVPIFKHHSKNISTFSRLHSKVFRYTPITPSCVSSRNSARLRPSALLLQLCHIPSSPGRLRRPSPSSKMLQSHSFCPAPRKWLRFTPSMESLSPRRLSRRPPTTMAPSPLFPPSMTRST